MVGVSGLGSRSSDFVAFMCFEVVKWEQYGRYKADKLHFNAKSTFKQEFDSCFQFIHVNEEQRKQIR